ncbi:hypothetical protein BDF21DRAFT_453681 [Thamnidium elegans]|uniref:Uncharacterized protein n=1 Tax=Thamnidium elegans TaxID=101142 RepID=A0A8H7SWG3_9FUNG|nr:hypothetical protein INT48_003120 [Thamnidium elegans]KAI8075635.1 hypothetical protein BDF21DRAFT_453681 [Thamnidium elegans]
MELNLCLYCEKRLSDDNMAFCSISCQSNEASKSYASYKLSNNTMLSPSVRLSGKPSSTYQMSYHRRPSLSYSTSTSTTTSHDGKQKTHASLSSSLSATRPPFFLMQSLSTSSSFSSSMSDVSVFSTSCSCEDKAGNICPPYHITRTTHNIAS